MRSSDAWLGWPYDVFVFSMMSALVAQKLNEYDGIWKGQLGLGTLILTAGSQHLYDKNIQKAQTVAQQDMTGANRDLPMIEMKPIAPHGALLKHLLRFTGGGLIGAILSEDICLLDALSQAKRSLQA